MARIESARLGRQNQSARYTRRRTRSTTHSTMTSPFKINSQIVFRQIEGDISARNMYELNAITQIEKYRFRKKRIRNKLQG